MDGLDLNIDNYSLHDLLDLFHLPPQFDMDDLCNARKIVMKTHPDKSGLPKEYFLFFSKAYKLLHALRVQRTSTTEYYTEDNSDEHLQKFVKDAEFQRKFNKLFEQHRLEAESDEGYGEWFKSNDDICDTTVRNQSEMNESIEKRKREARALCNYETVQSIGDDVNSNLDPNAPAHYGATLFSKLAFEDLRKAHTETVVPVDDSDLAARPTFQNEQSLRQHRAAQVIQPMTKAAATERVRTVAAYEDMASVERAYRLAKQDETVAKLNESLHSAFHMLT